jgi:AAHS family 3-hydroxyphenylpropionic acid transporter
MMVATLGIALPEIRQSFSLTEVAAGSLFSVMMIVAALTSAGAGRLADRIGPKKVLIAGLTLLGLGFAGAGMSQHRIVFAGFLALTGVGYGFTPPSLYLIISELLPQRRGFGASLISVAYGIGGAIGALLSSRVAALFGWRYAFLTVGVVGVTDMLVQLFFIREQHRPHNAKRSGSFRAALSFSLLMLAMLEFIGGSVFWSSAAWTPTALRSAKSLTIQQTGLIMSLLSIANMVGSFCLGSLSDKLGRRFVIMASAFPAALASFAVFYWLESVVAIAIGIFLFGVFKASVPALIVALAQETAPAGSAGTAAGVIMSLHYTSGVLAPLIAAKLIGATGDILLTMILVSSVPLVIYGSLIGAVRERNR